MQDNEQAAFKARIRRLEQLREIEAKIYLESTAIAYNMLTEPENDQDMLDTLWEFLNAA